MPHGLGSPGATLQLRESAPARVESPAMPDRRRHRGRHPQDEASFCPAAVPVLRAAVADLSWLLSRGYASTSALKLVGDRYQLRERQRWAVQRCACGDAERDARASREVRTLTGIPLLLDGYNVLTTVEAALAGAVILHARDGCYRDVASMHSSYRKVEETCPALDLLGGFLAHQGVPRCEWYFDSPVSNSGRLKTLMRQVAQARGWDWEIHLVANPDAVLRRAGGVVATADSAVLDRCGPWCSLAREVIRARIPEAFVLELGTDR